MSRRWCLALPAGLPLACGPAHGGSLVAGFTPATAAEGLFFGLAHPVSALDHLGALVGVATIAVVAGASFRLPLLFVLASLAGVRLHGFGAGVPLVGPLMALSVLACGLVLVLGWSMPRVLLAAGLAAAGVVHGSAYGEHVAGTGAATFLAALLGLAALLAAA